MQLLPCFDCHAIQPGCRNCLTPRTTPAIHKHALLELVEFVHVHDWWIVVCVVLVTQMSDGCHHCHWYRFVQVILPGDSCQVTLSVLRCV